MSSARVSGRLAELGRRSIPWPGVVFLVVMAQLALCNVHALDRNQEQYTAGERIERRSTGLKRVTAINEFPSVKWGFTLLYELRALRGATLIVSSRVPLDTFLVEIVSRLRVEMNPRPLMITEAGVKQIWESVTLWGRTSSETQMALVRQPGVTRYVVAGVVDNPQAFFIVPVELYARIAMPGHELEGAL